MNRSSFKSMSSTLILRCNPDGSILAKKGETSIILFAPKQNSHDSINTINTSFTSFKYPRSLKRSLSEEDLNLYESCVEETPGAKEELNLTSQKPSSKRLTNLTLEASQGLSGEQKELSRSKLSKVGMKVSNSGSEMEQKQVEKSGRIPNDMEETLQNIIQHLESSKENFESFDQSEIIGRTFLEEQVQNEVLEKTLEEKEGKIAEESSYMEEKDDLMSLDQSKIEEVAKKEDKEKKSGHVGKKGALLLFSVAVNLVFMWFLMGQKMEMTRVKDEPDVVVVEKIVEVEKLVNVSSSCGPEKYVFSPSDIYTTGEYRDLFLEKEGLYEENKLNKITIQWLERERRMLEEEMKLNNRTIAELSADKNRFQERFKELEGNLQHTIEIVSQLKKHLPTSLGDTIVNNFKQLLNNVQKII